MRVIITGGTGLIGRRPARSLAGDGQEVVVLSCRPEHTTGLPRLPRAGGISQAAQTRLSTRRAGVSMGPV